MTSSQASSGPLLARNARPNLLPLTLHPTDQEALGGMTIIVRIPTTSSTSPHRRLPIIIINISSNSSTIITSMASRRSHSLLLPRYTPISTITTPSLAQGQEDTPRHLLLIPSMSSPHMHTSTRPYRLSGPRCDMSRHQLHPPRRSRPHRVLSHRLTPLTSPSISMPIPPTTVPTG